MIRGWVGAGLALALVACGHHADHADLGASMDGSAPFDAGGLGVDLAQQAVDGGALVDAATGDMVATCNGYEPCAVYPPAAPAGYSLYGMITGSTTAQPGSCASFEDCPMWNTHFTKNYGNRYYYDRLGSPFPTPQSQYIWTVSPKTVQYAKLKITSPNEYYRYSDGTLVTETDSTSNTTTCFQRGAGSISTILVTNLGGTGTAGKVTWNISLLPGDMGNTGNVSVCSGNQNMDLRVTSDEAMAKAAYTTSSKLCLLREGQTYYVNFMSAGMTPAVDCATQSCSMAGFVVPEGFVTTSDGQPLLNQVTCPAQ